MPNYKKKSFFNEISRKFIIYLIRVYQFCISPFIGAKAACRFTPTCSEYTAQAIEKYGILGGLKLGFHRISRCRPGGGFGYDPVP